MRDNEKLLQALHGIDANLTGIRNLMRHQLERQTAENPTSANKGITWQEAAETLQNLCKAQRYCGDCPARTWCETAVHPTRGRCPGAWEVPADE